MELAYPHEHTDSKMTLALPSEDCFCHSPNWKWLLYWEGMIALTWQGWRWVLVWPQITLYWINFPWEKVGWEFAFYQVVLAHCLDTFVTAGVTIHCFQKNLLKDMFPVLYLEWNHLWWSHIPWYLLMRSLSLYVGKCQKNLCFPMWSRLFHAVRYSPLSIVTLQ